MSPLPLRRYRAERLLQEQFEDLRGRVLASAQGRLAAGGVRLDRADLEACYCQAWHGLYAAVLGGQEIANPTGWLVLVTCRRAIEEHRSRTRAAVSATRAPCAGGGAGAADVAEQAAVDPDLAGELDDRLRLRALVQGMRQRLSPREREAAALCYLHGLSRAEAAARMGISERRMRKLMEGRSRGRSGVAGKVGALARTIEQGRWCEEQASLMRALAFGILDPRGERYRLAVLHRRDCPACRSYVASLRGLAVVLPPPFAPLLHAAGAGALAATGSGHGAGALASAKGAAAGGAGAGAAGGGAAGSGAAGAGAAAAGAGSGWLVLGGPLGAKLAVGCLLVIGIGAGCAELLPGGAGQAHRGSGHRGAATGFQTTARARLAVGARAAAYVPAGPPPSGHAGALRTARAPRVRRATSAAVQEREFSIEAETGKGPGPALPAARAAAVAGRTSAPAPPPDAQAPSGPSAAEREFSPG